MNQIISTQDGSHSVFSEQFGVAYHSKYGAVQETEHVFIKGALLDKIKTQQEVAILDIGFGTGLNALMTYLSASKQTTKIQYTAIEAYPLSLEQALQLNYAEVLNLSEVEQQFFQQMHQTAWNKPIALSEDFTFTKCLQRFEEIDFKNQFDIIYFDAFAPNAQPELWEADLLNKMYQALKHKGILTTYCAKGVFKRTLKKVGFTVEALPGPPGKREMTRGHKHHSIK